MSPWVPTQPYYDDPISVRNYYNFSKAAGCPQTGDVFDCLQGKDTLSLQYASNMVSQSPPTVHGNWYVPSDRLLKIVFAIDAFQGFHSSHRRHLRDGPTKYNLYRPKSQGQRTADSPRREFSSPLDQWQCIDPSRTMPTKAP